ncbi:TfoX/Sxy family protein [Ramlibacter pallidus]|uniref:TfoX/Sxy family protein n=1 Tax=Ramlibacter pallidus TaxID=2780087 RepID=A0ABR9S303_9BURK|nr:TfoX/Sxy family protein [Ramlibacter pallidus]MBE7367887.1 TfoX/Sxy family protein [Ramlibacter pallidus]
MPPKDAFASYCAELLSALGPVRVRRMFGGHGIYVDDLFIAIVVGETLYLKADDQSLPRFEAAGCQPFSFTAKGRTMTTHYRAAPVDAMDSPALMRPWATLAIEAALRARAR